MNKDTAKNKDHRMMRERENGEKEENGNSDCQSYDEEHKHISMRQINEIDKEKESYII